MSEEVNFNLREELFFGEKKSDAEPLSVSEAEEFEKQKAQLNSSGMSPLEPCTTGETNLLSPVERVVEDWPSIEVKFGGRYDEHGYVDAVYFLYDDVDDKEAFEEYMVVHFKHWMEKDAENNKGIDPFEDDRIDISHERFRDFDDNLWLEPTEFMFRNAREMEEMRDEFGKYVRLWFDD